MFLATKNIVLLFVICFQTITGQLLAQEPGQSKTESSTGKPTITLEQVEKTVHVKIGEQAFTTYDFGTYAKPILYPIYGPGQIAMTRNWPMKKDVEGEAHDHPHHKSMWVAHEISGVDFWAESQGAIKTDSVELLEKEQGLCAVSSWVRKSDGKIMLTDETTYRFGATDNSRWIDCTIEFKATHGDFVFDDTKEGLFAIRTHPDLRLKANPGQGVKQVYGEAINSEGVMGRSVWGGKAKWMSYFGPIDGKKVSIAMYDHPSNFRHPTTWHARNYGLVTANPFGLHHFLGKEKGSGEQKIKNGESLKLRYRVEFFKGIATPPELEERFQVFARH